MTQKTTPARSEQPPLSPLDDYEACEPIIRHVRVMGKLMDKVERHPELGPHYAELHGLFMNVLSDEFQPFGLMLALAVSQLEDAYPEIIRAKPIWADGR
jgi:hypothetical protein